MSSSRRHGLAWVLLLLRMRMRRAAEVRRPLSYPRLHAENMLTAKQCLRLQRRAIQELAFSQAPVGSGRVGGEGVLMSGEARRARVAPVPQNHMLFSQVYARLWQFINATNEQFWRFAIAPGTVETMQYSIYSDRDNGTYDWHEDVGFHSDTSARVLSASVQLSDPGVYEGGMLQLRVGRHIVTADSAVGTAIVFPSHISHRVAPVVSGERHSLVLWVQC